MENEIQNLLKIKIYSVSDTKEHSIGQNMIDFIHAFLVAI